MIEAFGFGEYNIGGKNGEDQQKAEKQRIKYQNPTKKNIQETVKTVNNLPIEEISPDGLDS